MQLFNRDFVHGQVTENTNAAAPKLLLLVPFAFPLVMVKTIKNSVLGRRVDFDYMIAII
jgi:hypothetical protein